MTAQNNNSPERTKAWHQLAKCRRPQLREAFARDPGRAHRFSLELERVFVDFSKNLITDDILSLLLDLAEQRGLRHSIEQLFSGHEVNTTERRGALHTLLRTPDAPSGNAIEQTGSQDKLSAIVRQVHEQRNRMFRFVRRLRAGEIKGATGKPLSRVINIGIGGSDLGPRLLVEALSGFHQAGLDMDFVANIDPSDIERALARADPETTLFIVASKSFTTTETLANAERTRDWLRENGCHDYAGQFLAVSGNAAAVERFGIDRDRHFQLEDWTGGRYSVWSSIGMSAALSIGADNFKAFLAGAHALDRHFSTAEFSRNLPVILGLISIWHNNFLDIGAHGVFPYDQRLERLPAYLSQLVMESNGKSVSADGDGVGLNTSQIIWGGVGSPAQHAVFQFLHQGTRLSSIDFLLPLDGNRDSEQYALLVANCLAQGEALMLGKTDTAEPHRRFEGNRPSTTIVYERLDPYTLGMLLALYEHKTFVEAAIWGINPFDQWGVELGKTLARQITDEMTGAEVSRPHDSSTQQLLDKYRSTRT